MGTEYDVVLLISRQRCRAEERRHDHALKIPLVNDTHSATISVMRQLLSTYDVVLVERIFGNGVFDFLKTFSLDDHEGPDDVPLYVLSDIRISLQETASEALIVIHL